MLWHDYIYAAVLAIFCITGGITIRVLDRKHQKSGEPEIWG